MGWIETMIPPASDSSISMAINFLKQIGNPINQPKPVAFVSD
jgi:hypothetical protein